MKIIKNELLNLSQKTINQTIFDLKKSYRAQLLILKGQLSEINKNISLIHHFLLPQYKLYYYWYKSFREEDPNNPNFELETFEPFLQSLYEEDYYQIFNTFFKWYQRIDGSLFSEKVRAKINEFCFYLDQTDTTDKNLFILNSMDLIYRYSKYKSVRYIPINQEKDLLLACLILDANRTIDLVSDHKTNRADLKNRLCNLYSEKKTEWKLITKYEKPDKLFHDLIQSNLFSLDDNIQTIFDYWNVYLNLKKQKKFSQAFSMKNTVKYLLFIPFIKTYTDSELVKIFRLVDIPNPEITSTVSERLCNYYSYKAFNQIKPTQDSIKIEQIYSDNLFG